MKPMLRLILFLITLTSVNCFVPTAPLKVVYIDYRDVDWSDASVTIRAAIDAGYNVVNMGFFMSSSGAVDMALAWSQVPADKQISTINYAHSKNAVVMVSAGGSTDAPYLTTSGTAYGTAVANFVKNNNLDGVDFDMEGFGAGFVYGSLDTNATVQWLVDASIAARTVLGPNGVISHAPQAPYFGPLGSTTMWAGVLGGYTSVYLHASNAIDFFNIQFYNQGQNCYVSYQGLFKTSSQSNTCVFPGTSVQEIQSYGIPYSKLVVGKYLLAGDASNGMVSAGDLHQYFTQAQNELGWNAGVMCWQFQLAGGTSATWINTIYPTTASDEEKSDSHAALPQGWVAYTDDHGTPYYYNSVTQAKQWEYPSHPASRD